MKNNNNEVAKRKHLFIGKVFEKKMSKTASVYVERIFKDPIVKKVVKTKRKFHIHDPLDQSKIGDTIEFYEGPHISKIKYMYLHRIVSAAV